MAEGILTATLVLPMSTTRPATMTSSARGTMACESTPTTPIVLTRQMVMPQAEPPDLVGIDAVVADEEDVVPAGPHGVGKAQAIDRHAGVLEAA